MNKTDKFLRGLNIFVNGLTSFILTVGFVGGYTYFLDGIGTDRVGLWQWIMVFVWWIIISGKFSQRNDLRR